MKVEIFMSVLVVSVIAMPVCMTKSPEQVQVTEKTKLVAIQTKEKLKAEASFSGCVFVTQGQATASTQPVYRAYEQHADGSITMLEVTALSTREVKAKIFEEEGLTNEGYLVRHITKMTQTTLCAERVLEVIYEFHVPVGTVQRSFMLK